MGNFLNYLIESKESRKIMRPTEQWMKRNYSKFNKKFFNNELPRCDFEVFTKGKGSSGNVLGLFEYQENVFFGDTEENRLYKEIGNKKVYANSENFYEICRPIIKLNGNYDAPEESWFNTLLHEMVHLYNSKDGIEPNQPHGKDFKDACEMIEKKSNGRFHISRLTDSEKLKFVLDKDVSKKKEQTAYRRKRTIEKKRKAFFVFIRNGNVLLFNFISQKLIDGFINYLEKEKILPAVSRIVVSDDTWLFDRLDKEGFGSISSKYMCYELPDRLKRIVYDYDFKIIYSN